MSETLTVRINGLALMTTREKIAVYLGMHPQATVRAIQTACRISSPSVVQYHLERLETPRTICCPACQGKGRIRIERGA